MPLPGAQLLFARTEPNGRITLIRSAPVVRFEATPARIESGIHARPDSQPDVYAQPRSISQLDTQANAYGAGASPYVPAASPYARAASPYAQAVGSEEDEDLTIPCDAPTIPRGRRSSLPPDVRESGVVPAAPASSRRASIPPTPRLPRVQQVPDSVTRPTYNTIPGQPPPEHAPYAARGRRADSTPAFSSYESARRAESTPAFSPNASARRTESTPAFSPYAPARRAESTPAFSPYESPGRRGDSTPTFSPHESLTARAPRPSLPTRPTRPSIVRISTTDATEWDVATRPYQRAAR